MTGTMAELAATTGIDVPTGLLIGGQWTKGRDGGLIGVMTRPPRRSSPRWPTPRPRTRSTRSAPPRSRCPAGPRPPPASGPSACAGAWSLMIAKSDALARLMVCENGEALPDAGPR